MKPMAFTSNSSSRCGCKITIELDLAGRRMSWREGSECLIELQNIAEHALLDKFAACIFMVQDNRVLRV